MPFSDVTLNVVNDTPSRFAAPKITVQAAPPATKTSKTSELGPTGQSALGEDALRVMINHGGVPTASRTAPLRPDDLRSIASTALPIADWHALSHTSRGLRDAVHENVAYQKDERDYRTALNAIGGRSSSPRDNYLHTDLLKMQLPSAGPKTVELLLQKIQQNQSVSSSGMAPFDSVIGLLPQLPPKTASIVLQHMASQMYSSVSMLANVADVVGRIRPAHENKLASIIDRRGFRSDAWSRTFENKEAKAAAVIAKATPRLRSSLIKSMTTYDSDIMTASEIKRELDEHHSHVLSKANQQRFKVYFEAVEQAAQDRFDLQSRSSEEF